jgi:hypothetical protein
MANIEWLPDFERRTIDPKDCSSLSVDEANQCLLAEIITQERMKTSGIEGLLVTQRGIGEDDEVAFIGTEDISFYETDHLSEIRLFLNPTKFKNLPQPLRLCLSCTEFVPSSVFREAA